MKSFSKSSGAVGSEASKHSKHQFALRLFYSLIVFVVGAALLPVVPAAAKPIAPQVSSAASAYTAVNPKRAMDTRDGTGGVAVAPLGPGGTVSLVVAPNAIAGVPANATAVVMNVTVTNTTAASFLTVYPTGGSVPFASNLNWVAGYTVPNLVTVQPGTGGSVTFFNKFGNTDVIADIAGYFAPPSGSAGGEVGTGFPQRLVDTRAGSGKLGAGTSLGAGVTVTYQVTGNAGVPASGVSAVVLNATVTDTTAASFLTLWAAGATQNTVSNANWVTGWTRANRAIVPVSATGQISAFNKFGTTDLILDVDGYFTDATASGKLFTAVTPVRLTDHQPLGAGGTFNLSVGGVAGVPAGASAAILDAVVSETTAPSFLTAYPTGGSAGTSDINWVAGQVNPNLTVTTLGTGGQATFFNSAGNVNVSVDLEGYFGQGGGVTITASKTSIPADGASTSLIDVLVSDTSGNPVALDPVSLTTSGTPSTACGAVVPNSGTTGSNGKIATSTYHSTAVPGTCKITATELIKGQSASVTITETPPQNAVVITAPGNIDCNTSKSDGCGIDINADGTSTQNFTVTVTNPVTSAAVQGDTVTVANTANAGTPGACGTNGTLSGTTAGLTNASGQVTFIYTSSTTVGFCNMNATESATSGSDQVVVTQAVPGSIFNNGIALAATTTSTASGGACAFCTVQIFANGKDTVNLKETVSGASQNADPSLFTFTFNSPAGTCGTVVPQVGNTNTLGVLNAVYTASTTVGECHITVSEANSGNNTFISIGQDQVPATVTVTANPQTVPAVISSTSTLTVTAMSGIDGSALNGDTITFSTAANPGGACGAVSGGPFKTNASGQATATYTATTVPGFCHITANDTTSLGSNSARITQTNPISATFGTTVVANPTSIAADNVTPATSTISATVKTSGGTPAGAGDLVEFVKTGSVSGVCSGTVSASTIGTTGVASFTYTASSTVGTCTITATEANSGSSGSATVTQTAVANVVTVTPGATGTAVATTTTLAVHVAHLGTAVSADQIAFSTNANPSGACGTIDTLVPATGKTDGSGNVTAVYHASAVSGFCTVTASEGLGGQTGSTTIAQTNTAGNTTTVSYLPFTNPVANGTDTRAVTATVGGAGNHVNDTVIFTTGSAAPDGACGTLTVTSGNTGTGATATATYKASTTAGACTITAREANGNSSGTVVITSTQKPNNITVSANPTIVSVSGGGTSAISVSVTDGNTNAAVVGDHVTLGVSGAGCGTLSNITPASSNTDSSGSVTATYTVGGSLGSCSVTATDATGGSGSVNITQIA
jgi:hypothetical protein